MGNIHTVQLNLGDLMGGTAGMDAAEYGAYVSLFLTAYQTPDHRLPDDDGRLARMARCTVKQWQRVRPQVIIKFTHIQDGDKSFYVHSRVLEESVKYRVTSSKNKDNALKRWKSEMPLASNSQCDRNATQYPIPNTTTPSTSSSTARGSLEIGKWKIKDHITPSGITNAKKIAFGWDVYWLMEQYDLGVADRGLPESPDAAFVGWCKHFTKGNPPQ